MDKAIVYTILVLTLFAGFFAASGKTTKGVVVRGVVGSIVVCAVYFALLMWAHTLTPPKLTQ